MRNKLQNQFQLWLIYLFAVLASVGIAPFCVLRYLNGQILNALVDLAIVLVAISSAIYTYRKGKSTQLASNITAVLYTAGAVTVAHINDPIFVFWVFPALVANFFLLRTTMAALADLIAIGLVLPIAFQLESITHSFAMLSSLLMASSMAYVFALITQSQQKLLEGFATQDPLTGLGNRRAMNEALQLVSGDFNRTQLPVTLIVLDLDFFKQVNDHFGHSIGDEVLVEVGNLLAQRTRSTDRLFRFGGEEFVIVARGTGLADGVQIAEQLRHQLERDIKAANNRITASFGCAQLQAGETIEHWFDRADKAVYQAKQQGRNRVIAAD